MVKYTLLLLLLLWLYVGVWRTTCVHASVECVHIIILNLTYTIPT